MELSALDRMTAFGDNDICPQCESVVKTSLFKEHMQSHIKDVRIGRYYKKETPITSTNLRKQRELAAAQKVALERAKRSELVRETLDAFGGVRATNLALSDIIDAYKTQ